MTARLFAATGALSACVAVFGLASVAGQSGPAASSRPAAPAASQATGWTVPRTPDGKPDLQGIWSNSTATPLERPANLAGKEFFTEAEAVAYVARKLQDYKNKNDDTHYDDFVWLGGDSGRSGRTPLNLRTSLIVDPPDGKLPPLTPEAQKRVATRAIPTSDHMPADGPEIRTIQERCIMWTHEGPPMLPQSSSGPAVDYNANYQIVQTPGYVTIVQEMIHDARIIPLDGRAHPPSQVGQWLGVSVGRWEGDTLVVDTRNFTQTSYFFRGPNGALDGIHSRGPDSQLHVTERFTRTGPTTIRYQFTVEDPTTWTKPWSGEYPMWQVEGPIYEYACHEGNHSIVNILSAARAEERAGKRPAKK